jgi:uncharacterized protein with ATP-grasp and redox domains
MQTYIDCVPCFIRQALDACRMVTADPATHERVVRDTVRLVTKLPFDRPPPWMGRQIHRLLREATHDPDPYRDIKKRSNALALALYPELKRRVRMSADPFAAAVRLAIAGNVIDFGCRSSLSDDEVHQAIEEAADGPLDEAALRGLRRATEQARDILYLADNAGEIVFDRLLIEQMPRNRVTLVTRGSPVINDATREDAETAGLTSLVEVVDNGSDVPGTILEACSPSFQARFRKCDLVIAKGQGNYETLSSETHAIFFLFKAKCPVIARDIRCEVGQLVVCQNHRPQVAGSPEGTADSTAVVR